MRLNLLTLGAGSYLITWCRLLAVVRMTSAIFNPSVMEKADATTIKG
jgi:hypothetical protein